MIGARLVAGAIPALEADLRLAFTPTQLEALDRGVPLRLAWRLEARAEGRHLARRGALTLRYLPLAQQYQWLDDDGRSRLFPRRAQLLAALDQVRLPLDAGWAALPAGTRMEFALALDAAALPGPLRLPALLQPRWRLATPEHAWTVGG